MDVNAVKVTKRMKLSSRAEIMAEGRSETTAMQRVGYVFGWLGTGFGGLMIIAAIATAAYQYISVSSDVRRLTKEARELADQIREFPSTDSLSEPEGRMQGPWLRYSSIAEFRREYPEYNDMSDQELADRLYRKFYSDMTRAEFDEKFGLAPTKKQALGELLRRKDVEIQRAQTEYSNTMTAAVLFFLIPGILIVLLGQLLRYIFAGSFSSLPTGWRK